jgi:ethanolamine ammonia-lyase small subunit
MNHQIPSPDHAKHLNQLISATPARVGVWRTGTRPLTSSWLKFREDHALARDAVHSELSPQFWSWIEERGFPVIQTLAADRADFILNPPLGKKMSPEILEQLATACLAQQDVQIVISDGLSAMAVEDNVMDLLPSLEIGLRQNGLTSGLPVVVKLGRVAIGDQIAERLQSKSVINLIGERPGLSAIGLSAYITYNPGAHTISSDRTVVSNIHRQGTPAVEAGAYIVQLLVRILESGASGVRLQQLL